MQRTRRKKLVSSLYLFAGLVIAADQLTKEIIRQSLEVGQSIPVIPGWFHITYITNTGAAFGILPSAASIFLMAKIAVIIGIITLQFIMPTESKKWLATEGLILGGAVGNLIDRLFLSSVTDFLDFQIWPVFNIADMSIVIGAALLSILIIRGSEEYGASQTMEGV